MDTPDHDATQASGWLIGDRYRVQERIGSGGMAEVFRAHDELLGRDVAVKVFRSLGPDDEAGKVERRDLELQALARLSHPNLITLFDASLNERPPYLVTELVDGPTLADRISDGPIAEPQVRAIGIQLADALSYVHAHGMVHRDVKPANILLGTDVTEPAVPRARLSDFGIVRLLGSERVTSADLTLGTASYLAPEQAGGSEVDPGADVYSLGLVLLEALTGTRTYDGPALEAVLARLANPPQVPSDLPTPWPDLLAAMTATDPAHRPTPAEVARTLRDEPAAGIAAMSAASATTTAIPRVAAMAAAAGVRAAEFDEPRRRGIGMWLVAAAALALILGSGYFILAGSPDQDGSPPRTVPTQSTRHAPSKPRTSTSAVSVESSTQPRTSSQAPTTPQPPTTSAAPTTASTVPPTSSVPPTTSAAPTTTAATTSAAAAPSP